MFQPTSTTGGDLSSAAGGVDEPTITDLDVLANSLAQSNQNGQFLHDLDQEELSAFLDSLSPRLPSSNGGSVTDNPMIQWQTSAPMSYNTAVIGNSGFPFTTTNGAHQPRAPLQQLSTRSPAYQPTSSSSSSHAVVSSTKPSPVDGSCTGPKGMTQCVCETCGKVFNSVWYLKQHAVKHSNDRPFRCKYCGKTYKFRSNLYQHKCPDRVRLQGPRQPRRKRSNKDGKPLGPTPPATGKQDSPASSSSNSNSLSLTPSIPYSFLPTPYGATACAPLPASMGRVSGGPMPPNYMTPPSSRYEQPPRVAGGNVYGPPPAHGGHMYSLKCAQCSETFADEQSRVHHAQHRHSLNAQHVCASCGGRFSNQLHVQEHQRQSVCGRPLDNSAVVMSAAHQSYQYADIRLPSNNNNTIILKPDCVNDDDDDDGSTEDETGGETTTESEENGHKPGLGTGDVCADKKADGGASGDSNGPAAADSTNAHRLSVNDSGRGTSSVTSTSTSPASGASPDSLGGHGGATDTPPAHALLLTMATHHSSTAGQSVPQLNDDDDVKSDADESDSPADRLDSADTVLTMVSRARRHTVDLIDLKSVRVQVTQHVIDKSPSPQTATELSVHVEDWSLTSDAALVSNAAASQPDTIMTHDGWTDVRTLVSCRHCRETFPKLVITGRTWALHSDESYRGRVRQPLIQHQPVTQH